MENDLQGKSLQIDLKSPPSEAAEWHIRFSDLIQCADRSSVSNRHSIFESPDQRKVLDLDLEKASGQAGFGHIQHLCLKHKTKVQITCI